MSTQPAPQTLIEAFRNKKLTLSFAESCTGGKLSAVFTEVPGVSDIFLGSIVSYANSAKIDLLGVRRDTLQNEGAVSEFVACQMAQGVRQKFKSDWSVAITGIAGPAGGTVEKPVGTVYFAVCGPQFERAQRKLFSGDRLSIQSAAVQSAIQFLQECFENKK